VVKLGQATRTVRQTNSFNAASDSVESVQFIFGAWRTRLWLAGRWECRDRRWSQSQLLVTYLDRGVRGPGL
jgi:hypothetical protein